MAWCGAEAKHQFESKVQYDIARKLLDKALKHQIHGNELPSAYSRIVSDYYLVENDEREAFEEIMRRF